MLPPFDLSQGFHSPLDGIVIVPERVGDSETIEGLMDAAFGSDRRGKTVYQLRDGYTPVAPLCLIAMDQVGAVRASIRYWQVSVAGSDLKFLLLGPLAVDPLIRGGGLGKALVARSLDRARDLGFDICLVVGEPSFYGNFGFTNASALGFELPGPVELRRFMVKEICPNVLFGADCGGMVGAYEQEPS